MTNVSGNLRTDKSGNLEIYFSSNLKNITANLQTDVSGNTSYGFFGWFKYKIKKK